MSSAIRETEKLNQRQVETARRRGEREVKAMEESHQNHKAELKNAHNTEIIEIQDVHHRQVNQQAEKKEKLLEELKTNLDRTTVLTEKQLKDLKNDANTDRAETQKKLSVDRERINAEHELYLEEINDRFNVQSRKVATDGKNRVQNVKDNMREEAIETEKFLQNKIQTQTEAQNIRFNQDATNYKNIKYQQDNQFKKERMGTNQRQQVQMSKMTQTHNDHLEQKDTEYRKGLKEQENFFEKKYTGQIAKNNADFKILEEKNKAVVEDLKSNLTKEITQTAVRNSDPFYKFEAMKPRLKQFEDRVEVEVNVPDHSKQDVMLTIHGKEAIVNFNRRYSDASKGADGTINKINKIETFTTRIPTGHILDAKSVKSSYESGVMSYVIKKA
jgi:hypothetical protein